jgi:hypothetical protein
MDQLRNKKIRALGCWLFALIAIQPGTASASELSRFCGIVNAHNERRLKALIAHNVLREKGITTDMYVDARKYVAKSAWQSANKDSIDEFTSGASPHESGTRVSRAPLFRGEPDAWLITVWIGSLQDPNIWIFHSAPDGTHAEQYVGHLGEEGSGSFDTKYARLDDQPIAIEISQGDTRNFYYVYVLGQSSPVCRW